MRPRLGLVFLLLFSLGCAARGQTSSSSSDRDQPALFPIAGAKIFQHNCAECHGTDGRGHGPGAAALKHTAPDLTRIAQRNGGRFPYQRVKEIIEGKHPGLLGHGDQEMPIWGPIFHQVEADQDWGEVRLHAITKQVESMQRK
jgi:mono/diheme cytochrome c family protein